MGSEPDYKRLFLEERRLREEEERRRKEEERRRKEEERRREEEQRRREEGERRNQSSTLPEFLNAYHELFRKIRPRPNKLCEWAGAPDQLEKIWQQVLSPDVVERRLFTPEFVIEHHHHGRLHQAIGSELDLRFFQSSMLEEPITLIIKEFCRIPELQKRFRLKGTVEYATHANTLTSRASSRNRSSSKRRRLSPSRETSSSREWGAADMFCVYNIDGINSQQLILVAEYKAPHKLGIDDIRLGLRDMDLDQITLADVDEDLTDAERIIRVCCQCVGALVTQAFAYMVSRGLRYGYISTGEVFIFLHIKQEDPGTCYYFLSTPSSDVGDTTGWDSEDCTRENRLHLTALSQVLAFTLLAKNSDPEGTDWRDSVRESLAIWDLPTTTLIPQLADLRERCPHANLSPSTTHRIANDLYAKKSPIRLIRKHRMKSESPPSPTPAGHRRFDDSDDNGSGAGNWPGRPGSNVAVVIRQKSDRGRNHPPSQSSGGHGGGQSGASNQYCTHQCLLGLVRQQPLDPRCPNVEKHGSSHQINATELVQRLREQYAKSFAGLKELYIHGAVGALYKATLLSHGYTMVAKATKSSRITYLEHEASIYKKLESVQGDCVPVYVGAFTLKRTFLYLPEWRISYMMLMSYGGVSIQRLERYAPEMGPPDMSRYQEISDTLETLGVHHNDFEDRNQLYDIESKRAMVVDFERSELKLQKPKAIPSSKNKRRKSRDDTNQDRNILKKIRWNQRAGHDHGENTQLEGNNNK